MSTDTASRSSTQSYDTPTTMASVDDITTGSLQTLQSAEQRKVMDIVDKLRRTGLSGIIELPQLVVCGDQSSGKSSVLEAITEIPFPRKENLCTRFATEIILRRSPSSTSTITITPDKLRPQSEQATLRSFNRTLNNFGELPDVIEEATQAMGLGTIGGINSRAFSRDVLSIEITGPTRPQLTLVDLPGLIHATNKAQTETDKELILNLVKEYMSNPRTIILAVVSAKNDFANQIILDHCRKIDKQGKRTIGIITKPDYLREGSDNELAWIELAQNKDIYLERGWHMLKNRSDDQMDFSFDQRNEDELLFFSKGRFANLSRECVGIESLCNRLSKGLLDHLIEELPTLKKEIDDKLEATHIDIEELGPKRSTTHEQRMALMKISTGVNDILKASIRGNYDSLFFGSIDMDASVDADANLRRFRAVIQYHNIRFARDMRLCGHKYAFGVGPGDEEKDIEEDTNTRKELDGLKDDSRFVSLPKPEKKSREEALEWMHKILERSRGLELPGTFQPMLYSQLFWEQSQPWEKIASQHIEAIAAICRKFVTLVLRENAPTELIARITALKVDGELARSLRDAKHELSKVLEDKARPPITYNHYFTTTVQKMRQRKHQNITEQAKRGCVVRASDDYEKKTYLDQAKFDVAMSKAIQLDMDAFSSEEALDIQRAYYKDELKYFINTVAKTVVERHLVVPLPDAILSPIVVTDMTDEEVAYVAAEPTEITQQRTFLESRQTMLENGLAIFREAMGGFVR